MSDTLSSLSPLRDRFRQSFQVSTLLAIQTCTVALGGALWLQDQGDAPCPLCIVQRLGFLAMLVGALLALASRSWRVGRRCSLRLGMAGGAIGWIAALRHVWVAWHPTTVCGLDPLAAQINAWPITHLVPWFLRADGVCNQVPTLLSVPLPVWSVLALTASGLLLLRAWYAAKRL